LKRNATFCENTQIYDDVSVDVAFDASIAVLHDFFPDRSLADLGDQAAPFLRPEGGFALVGVELDDGVEDGQV